MRLRMQHRWKEAALLLAFGLVSARAVWMSAQQAQPPAGQAAAAPAAGDPQEVRFAVAHQHGFSWCYGYLYVSQDKVRYEVVQPQSNQSHSFDAQRSEVTVRPWVIMGQPQDAFELKVKKATYHMRWLANESEVNTGGAKRMSPPNSAAPDALIAAIQNPVSVAH